MGESCSDDRRPVADGGPGTGGSAGDANGGGGGYGGSCPYHLPCPQCGDGTVDPGEACDDGNTAFGDGCNGLCQVETHWNCSEGYCRPITVCGDQLKMADEACDDGNVLSGDGCAGDCLAVEPGWYCRAPGLPCQRVGSATTSLDGGPDCNTGGGCVPECGNGVVEDGEQCDEGVWKDRPAHNDDDEYGGCTTTCRLGPRCGDGMVNGQEECDLGEWNGERGTSLGGCTLACTRARFCGDGLPDGDLGEECDLGTLNGEPQSGCSSACKNVAEPKHCFLCL